MSLMIKTMTTPFNCCECLTSGLAKLSGCPKWEETKFSHGDCPISEVPDHHGRLIDADRLLAMIRSTAGDTEYVPLTAVLDSIRFAPTVIEAINKRS